MITDHKWQSSNNNTPKRLSLLGLIFVWSMISGCSGSDDAGSVESPGTQSVGTESQGKQPGDLSSDQNYVWFANYTLSYNSCYVQKNGVGGELCTSLEEAKQRFQSQSNFTSFDTRDPDGDRIDTETSKSELNDQNLSQDEVVNSTDEGPQSGELADAFEETDRLDESVLTDDPEVDTSNTNDVTEDPSTPPSPITDEGPSSELIDPNDSEDTGLQEDFELLTESGDKETGSEKNDLNDPNEFENVDKSEENNSLEKDVASQSDNPLRSQMKIDVESNASDLLRRSEEINKEIDATLNKTSKSLSSQIPIDQTDLNVVEDTARFLNQSRGSREDIERTREKLRSNAPVRDLLSENERLWLVQLISVIDEYAATRALNINPVEGANVLCYEVDDLERCAIVIGPFNTQSEARAAYTDLPQFYSKNNPFLRTIRAFKKLNAKQVE